VLNQPFPSNCSRRPPSSPPLRPMLAAVPLHQFEQSPIVIEVKDRNPSPDDMVYIGPNVVAGYAHPETGKIVKDQAEHKQVMATMASVDGGSHAPV
jgi:hypothetical protein